MRRQSILFQSLSLILLVASFCAVNADDWMPAHKKEYYSANKKYALEVFPKTVDGRVAKGSNNRARAVFYVKHKDGSYSKQAEFPLVNEVGPLSAIVSDGGAYFVTFDNWYRVGYGNDTVVIYRTDGSVVKTFALDDLLQEGEISKLRRSVSSIWWGGAHYFDEQNGLLFLKIVSNSKSAWEKDATFYEVKIELATGKPVPVRE